MSEYSVLAWGMPSGWEWIVILIIVLIVFGKSLPAVARGLGKSISEFKKGTKEGREEDSTDKPQNQDGIKK